MTPFVPPAPLRTAVLFIAFKRYAESKAVMEAIRAARPPRFYFACDGARNDKERKEVEKVRSLAKLVDWPCEFKTNFSDKNLSVKFAPPAAIDWFFEQEEEGIILEDDCLPQPSWFWYAQEMLDHYRHDERIWVVMGNNLMPEWPLKNDDSYYFSSHGYGAYWGWASWRRTWRKYDLHMSVWPQLRDSGLLDGNFLSRNERQEAHHLLESSWDGRIHSWDFQLDYGRIMHGCVNIIPNVNLIRNIGFGYGSTHTSSQLDPRNKEEAANISFPLKHPAFMIVDNRRDLTYFERYIQPSALRRFKNLVKKALPQELDKAVTPFLGKLQRKLGLN